MKILNINSNKIKDNNEVNICDHIIDDIIKNEHYKTIEKETGSSCQITNYAVTCNGMLLCFCGTDIIFAENVKYALRKIYKDEIFEVTFEFMSFEE